MEITVLLFVTIIHFIEYSANIFTDFIVPSA